MQVNKTSFAIGDSRFTCYQDIEGNYWFSQSQVAAALSVHKTVVLRTLNSSLLVQNLISEGSQVKEKIKLQVSGSKGSRGVTSYVEKLLSADVTSVLIVALSPASPIAFAITGALVRRSLTQMADVAFGVHRSDAEYQALTDAAYSLLRDKFRKQYIPKFHDYLVAAWRKLTKVPPGIQSSSHWRANEVYKLKKAIGLDYLTTVDEYALPDLQRYEQALLDYDCQRRSGLSHRAAYRKLAETVASLQEVR